MRFFLIFLCCAAVSGLGAATVDVSVTRTVAVEGDAFYYTLNYDESPDELQLPPLENGEWLTNMQQRGTSYVNGKRSTSLSVGIRGLKAGILNIPSFTLKFKGKPVEIKALQVRIVPRGEQPVDTGKAGESIPMKEAAFGVIRYDDANRKSCYVGEEVPLRLSLYALPALRPRLVQLPQLEAPSVILRTYRWRDGSARDFQEPEGRERIINGRRYVEYEFLTEFRAISPGKLAPQAEITFEISPGQERGFFSMVEGKPFQLKFAPAPELEVKPLPPAPPGAIALPLVGSWKLEGAFDKKECKVGEALTLNLKLSGTNSPEGITAPALNFDAFRSFPPEVQKEKNNTTLFRYALVPLKAGDFSSLLKFSTFNPLTKQYEIHDVALALDILPGETRNGIAVDEGKALSQTESAPPKEPERTELFYQKSSPGKAVRLPLYTNTLPWVILFAALGIAIAAGGELFRHLRRKGAADRRRGLKRHLPKLLGELKQCDSPEAFDRILKERVLPFLAESLLLPPSATAPEIAAKIDDPEIKELLERNGESSYLPGATGFRPEYPKLLIRFLKHLSFLLLLCFALNAEASFESGNDLFDRGEFKKALTEYQAALDRAAPCPGTLYNIGGAAWQLNDLPLARISLERARLLDPRDPETRENLKLVNRKLLQNGNKKTNAFTAHVVSLRDYLRPDEHMLGASIFFLLLCVLFACRRGIPNTPGWSMAGVLAFCLALSVAAAASQSYDTYDPARGIVNGQLELRTLPGGTIGSVSATIPGGNDAKILERRGEYLKIECNGRTGWAPAERITPVFE